MTATHPERSSELHQLALHVAAAVLGAGRARHIIEGSLQELRIELQTPSDPFLLAEAMTELGGFEGAVGAMLGVVAVMRGGGPSKRSRLETSEHSR